LHQEQLATFLDATDIRTSPDLVTLGGASAVTVTATLPPDEQAADRTPRVVRTAFLRFPGRPLVELTLHALATDTGAEAEFARLLNSVRPAADPLDGLAESLAAGPSGQADHPAGAVRIDLTPDYRATPSFAVASADGSQLFRMERAVADEAATRAITPGTLLSAGVGVARSEDGRPVRYETGIRPRRSPPHPAAAAVPSEALRGVAPALPPGPGETLVNGSVRGVPVRVRVTAGGPDVNAHALGEEVLRELNRPR
jgi:hypothetical protein